MCPSTSDLKTVKLSAYADDVTVFIRSAQDVRILREYLEVYQKASSSRINWQKCASFLLGEWENGGPPVLPQNCSWSLEGFKVLGIFLGTDQYIQKNWDGMFEKVSGRIQRWRWILKQLSYRGRVLIINNLAASMMWHRLNVLDPPKDLLQRLQKTFVEFFWDGYHWLPPAILYLPVNEGGQGLIDLAAKVKAMRLKTVQSLLYSVDFRPWISFGLALLRTFGGFCLDRQLFLMSSYDGKFSPDVKFYTSVLNSWTCVKLIRNEMNHFGLEEPLFYNSILGDNVCTSNTMVKHFFEKKLTKVFDLIDTLSKKWRPIIEIANQAGIKSVRTVERLIGGLKASFPSTLLLFVNSFLSGGPSEVLFPKILISPKVGFEENDVGKLLTFNRLQELDFQMVGKRDLYQLCVKLDYFENIKDRDDTKWRDFLKVPTTLSPDH